MIVLDLCCRILGFFVRFVSKNHVKNTQNILHLVLWWSPSWFNPCVCALARARPTIGIGGKNRPTQETQYKKIILGFDKRSKNLFLLLSCSGLILLQTTNNVFNKSLYEFVNPQSLLAWHRVRLSNLVARSGKEWAETFKLYNSGIF